MILNNIPKFDENGLKFTDLNLLLLSENNCKIELDSNIQISGRLKSCIVRSNSLEISYLEFEGHTELKIENEILSKNTQDIESRGFGVPIGFLEDYPFKSLAEFDKATLIKIGIEPGNHVILKYESGIIVEGVLKHWKFYKTNNKENIKILQFNECTVKRIEKKQESFQNKNQETSKSVLQEEILFRPEWGTFDLAVGSKVIYASI